MHRVVALRRGVACGRVAAHGADIGGDLPDLFVWDLARKEGMPLGRPSRMVWTMFSMEPP